MYLQYKVNKEADKASGLSGTGTDEKKEQAEIGSDDYYIEVNLKKNAVTVYQYSKDKKSKKAYKVFQCSPGKDLETGKYKISDKFAWVDMNGAWHRYSTKFQNNSYIQSAGYRDKYPNTLEKDSYNAVGDKKSNGKCIILYAKDAEWIYSNCKVGTVIKVEKGKKTDSLPLVPENTVMPLKYCGWDPTDTDKDNPYQKMENGKIVSGTDTVYVEKGEAAEYISNLIAKDETGKNVTGKLKYKKIDTSVLGSKKVKFSYKLKSGKTMSYTQKFVVIDTVPPKVSCSKAQFTYQVKSRNEKDMNAESNVTDIEKMVRSYVSCNESGVKITVSTVGAKELREGNFPVVIKAQDEAGNVGSCQVMCEITVQAPEKGKKYEPSKKVLEELEKKRGENQTETTKASANKKEKETKKNSSDKDEEESSEK